jgi:hypothetical protein
MKILILGLVAGLSGCISTRPGLIVEMNGRKLEFENFEAGKLPKGTEVTHFDPRSIKVLGDHPIEVNGFSVLAQGEAFTIGSRTISADHDAEIHVRANGEIEVHLPGGPATGSKMAGPSPPTQPTGR